MAASSDSLGESVHSATVFAVVLVAAIGWVSATLRLRQEKALADAQLVASIARRVLLRPVPERVGTVRAAVHYEAAAAHARIGGDLYEVVNTRHGVRAVVGDVRGKGLGAVETAAAVLGAFREAAHQEPALDRVAGWLAVSLDRALHENEHPGVEEEFVTLVLIGVRPDGTAEIVNCGHPSPLLLRGTEPVRPLELAETVPPLGVLDPVDVRPPVHEVPLRQGDRVLLFTDGVIEARDRWRLLPARRAAAALRGRPPGGRPAAPAPGRGPPRRPPARRRRGDAAAPVRPARAGAAPAAPERAADAPPELTARHGRTA